MNLCLQIRKKTIYFNLEKYLLTSFMRKFINFTNRSMFDRIWCNLENTELQKKRPQVLCTISGGQDSIVNFFIIFSLLLFQKQKTVKKKFFFEKKTTDIKILYCHHFWQIKNFFVTFLIFRISFLFQIPFFLVLPENRSLNENRSRGWRKKNFYRICRLERITNLVTGHTETDTVEKNLNNLFRGTSTKGLREFKILIPRNSQNMFFSFLILRTGYSYTLSHFFNQSTFFFYYKNKINCTRIKNILRSANNFFFFQIEKKNSIKLLYDSTSFVYENNQVRRKKSELNLYLHSVSFCFYSQTLKQKVNFNKPLQSIRRSTISELVTFFKLPLLIDLTNYSSNFSRNKFRYEIIPFMRSRSHKKVESLLGNFFQTASLDHEEIDRQLIEIFFLYKILPLLYFQNLESVQNTYLPGTLERSFLQKTMVDYKNIELIFSQLTGIQAQVGQKNKNSFVQT